MAARLIPVGAPANEAEPLAFRFLQENLPETCTVFTNPTLVNAQGVAREVDAVVVAPHALFAVEVKSWHGRIEGTDHDWYVPHREPSPVLKIRQTAQMLAGELRKRTHEAGRLWVQGLVFLSHTTQVGELGPLSRHLVVTRNQVIRALTDPEPLLRQTGHKSLSPVSPGVIDELVRLLRPPRRERRQIQAYDLEDQLEGTDRYAEWTAVHRMTREQRILRIYALPDDASPERRERLRTRVLWEAQVLRRLGQHRGILDADPPFEDEAGLVLPLERFPGITLSGWIERYHKALEGTAGGSLSARLALWERVADALGYAHDNGVVHRLLRPEAVLVQDRLEDPEVRVTDFDLAKQLSTGVTVTWTAVPDERRRWSAPEVLSNFSDADPRSDQFSLGALLGYVLCGEPLFQGTADLVREPRLVRRVRDLRIHLPQRLDLAVARMLQVRSADRFPSLDEARRAVREGPLGTGPAIEARPPLDPDDLKPGQRVGDDYSVESRIGEGGMGVVYAARHRLSGAIHVLKVAKPGLEDALRAEFQALQRLNHPSIVRPITVSSMVPDRFTLVMERAGSRSLARWLSERPELTGNALRKLAEDLLSVLQYLEAAEQDLVHKDLKPDNLLVTDEGGLAVIDFSAVGAAEDEPFAGTPRYRDPAWRRWSHQTDRYAAALCLFELYVGRHPFGAGSPEPDIAPALDPGEVDPPGLVTFFARALDPDPGRRPASAVALRALFLESLGARVPVAEPHADEITDEIGPETPLSRVGLSGRASNQLRRSGVRTVGELLALSDPQIFAIHAVGGKTAREIRSFRDRMAKAGLRPSRAPLALAEPLMPGLAEDPAPIAALRLSPKLIGSLIAAGLDTVGKIASCARDDLLSVRGVGGARGAVVIRALQARLAESQSAGPPTLDLLWQRAVLALTDRQQRILDATVGLTLAVQSQAELAAQLGVSQPTVSRDLGEALEALDPGALEGPRAFVEQLVDEWGGGAVPLELARDRLCERWDGTPAIGEAWVRLLCRVAADRLALAEVEELDRPLVTRAALTPEKVARFVREARRQAQWPPQEPEGARRALRAAVSESELPGDPLVVAVRLLPELGLTDRGELFEGPVRASDALSAVLARERPPIPIARLRERVQEMFGGSAQLPEDPELGSALDGLGYRAVGDRVVAADAASIAVPLGPADPVPEALRQDRIGQALQAARESRGFRLVVSRPEGHLAVARSVAARLGAPLVSFADRWFRQHRADLDRLERAERFAAQRARLTRAAEQTFEALLAEHGHPGEAVVIGDTGILGVLGALDLVRRWYGETRSGDRGFWVLVIPGIVRERQPYFNGVTPVFHLEGVVLPVDEPISGGGAG